MHTPIVLLENVSKVFGRNSANQTVALEKIDLAIEPGEFVTLIGPSGCGKSTLLRLIGDLLLPTAGVIRINGKSARQARLDRDYGIVLQSPVLFEWRTVRGNVELPLQIMRVGAAEREKRAQAMLELVELGNFGERYPWQLSGGMQQRVAIARALAPRPLLLLMDEPFGALDELTRERLNTELLALWERTGTTIIFVTHSIPEAIFLSTRVLVLSPRPGHITRQIDVDLAQPRANETREQSRYFELINAVREALKADESERQLTR